MIAELAEVAQRRAAATTDGPYWRAASIDPINHWRVNTTRVECQHNHREHRTAYACAIRRGFQP